MTAHATAVAIGARAVLLRGRSGAGKSDVALRLLALPGDALRAFGQPTCEVQLVADDRVHLTRHEARIEASAPGSIAGLLEVRGLGIVRVHSAPTPCEVVLVVDLVAPAEVMRLPEPRTTDILGLRLPVLALSAFDASTPIKIALALVQRPWS